MKTRIFSTVLRLITVIAFIGCATTSVVKDQQNVTKQEVPFSYKDVSYAKLGSEAFADDYAGKGVQFKIMFIGEWTITTVYQMGGIDTKDRVFINHRDISYLAAETGLGSSDITLPPFALSLEKTKSDIIYEAKRSDIFEIKGLAKKAGLPGKVGLHIIIHNIQKVTQR